MSRSRLTQQIHLLSLYDAVFLNVHNVPSFSTVPYVPTVPSVPTVGNVSTVPNVAAVLTVSYVSHYSRCF